jgi:hypothetical protein
MSTQSDVTTGRVVGIKSTYLHELELSRYYGVTIIDGTYNSSDH